MNKIFFPFYGKKEQELLRRKWWLKLIIFLYLSVTSFLIFIIINRSSGTTATVSCHQGLCAILETFPPWPLKKIIGFSVLLGLIYYLLQWVFLKIVIKFLKNKK
jgi:DNA integrity scanning protein DisA with diadenylate cyclase activity